MHHQRHIHFLCQTWKWGLKICTIMMVIGETERSTDLTSEYQAIKSMKPVSLFYNLSPWSFLQVSPLTRLQIKTRGRHVSRRVINLYFVRFDCCYVSCQCFWVVFPMLFSHSFCRNVFEVSLKEETVEWKSRGSLVIIITEDRLWRRMDDDDGKEEGEW